MIERNQDLALPNKGLRAFLFSTQHRRPLGMIMNETDVKKVNDLKVEVVDACEQHVSLINANSEIKNKNMFFIPMTLDKKEHHVVFVIHTKGKVVHYLDNIKRRKDYKDAATLHKLIVGYFFDFLDAFDHSCADEVLNYKLRIVKMP